MTKDSIFRWFWIHEHQAHQAHWRYLWLRSHPATCPPNSACLCVCVVVCASPHSSVALLWFTTVFASICYSGQGRKGGSTKERIVLGYLSHVRSPGLLCPWKRARTKRPMPLSSGQFYCRTNSHFVFKHMCTFWCCVILPLSLHHDISRYLCLPKNVLHATMLVSGSDSPIRRISGSIFFQLCRALRVLGRYVARLSRASCERYWSNPAFQCWLRTLRCLAWCFSRFPKITTVTNQKTFIWYMLKCRN